VLDPDPCRQRLVRLTMVLGWVALAIVASALLLTWRSGRHRSTVFGVMVLALLILTVGRVDSGLSAALWVAFAVAARIGYLKSPGRGRRALFVLVVCATAVAFVTPHLLERLKRS
jgi:hypothetical protein